MDVAHLAQVNIAVAREPLDAPLLEEFVAALVPVNQRAEAAPGFVWRMQTGEGDALGVRGFGGDPRLIINLTVWETLDALRAFAYRDPVHLAVMRQRRRWFERLDLSLVLWWVPAGHLPTVPEAEARLQHLGDHGASPYAFSFASPFGPDAASAAVDERDLCSA